MNPLDAKLKRQFQSLVSGDLMKQSVPGEVEGRGGGVVEERGGGVVEEREAVPRKKQRQVIVDVDLEKPVVDEGLHRGTMKSPLLVIAKTFIQACPSQIIAINELISMSSNNRFLATVSDLVDVGNGPMLVVESGLQPIKSYFLQPVDYYLGDCREESRAEWWNHISTTFEKIFRDIVHGLIYLNSLGHKGTQFYVSENGEGKVLPLMDKTATEEHDIKGLMDIMREILTLPFPETEVNGSYKLPDDLTFMLDYVTENALEHIPFYWLINQSYFWSEDEKISFVKDFTKYLKENVFDKVEINNYLGTTHFAVNVSDWSLSIDSSALGGLFQRIYNKPKNSRGGIRSYSGRDFLDVVRYCTNCYNHANEDTYHLAVQRHYYSDHELEGHLSKFFPMLYIDLYGALGYLASYYFPNKSSPHLLNAFEHWSRSYLATKD